MFGYIRPMTGELRVREYELYKSVYCGLCISGGKKISKFTRFFLNYDFVFLCLLRMAVTGEKFEVETRRCPYNLKKKAMVSENETLTFTCAAFAVLTYYKVIDDINDSKGIKKIIKKFSLPIFKRMKKRASRLYPEIDGYISNPLNELNMLEADGCGSIDRIADTFARITASIASGGTTGESNGILSECGYHVGRYIYLIDAFEDSANDEASGSYNVLNLYYGSALKTLENIKEIEMTLDDSVSAFCRTFEKNGSCCFNDLIYNIMQLGSVNAFRQASEKLKGTQR